MCLLKETKATESPDDEVTGYVLMDKLPGGGYSSLYPSISEPHYIKDKWYEANTFPNFCRLRYRENIVPGFHGFHNFQDAKEFLFSYKYIKRNLVVLECTFKSIIAHGKFEDDNNLYDALKSLKRKIIIERVYIDYDYDLEPHYVMVSENNELKYINVYKTKKGGDHEVIF